MSYWTGNALRPICATLWTLLLISGPKSLLAESAEPFIYATELDEEDIVVKVHVPSGHLSAVLELSLIHI